ncbi:hypothetical protein M1N41_02535, partial [Thermodesulfovibrionales bacterium]|nr:hypothetical protein [Thermodesulfovibrionales bacterium]
CMYNSLQKNACYISFKKFHVRMISTILQNCKEILQSPVLAHELSGTTFHVVIIGGNTRII